MPAFSGTAPGKAILFGEHAVVYGQPAIAVPVTQVQAKAVVMADPSLKRGEFILSAPDIMLDCSLDQIPEGHALRRLFDALKDYHQIDHFPSARMKITSTIPMEAGLGSGAAVSAAIVRTVSAFLGRVIDDGAVSALVYEAEKVYHGTPSGIDNTVIAYSKPVYFIRGKTIEPLHPAESFCLVIADTGLTSRTSEVVGGVRARWENDTAAYESIFQTIGSLADQARMRIENKPWQALGPLMNRNHEFLQELNVSSPELDRLVTCALEAGALGAKLSGAGRGGNIIALVDPSDQERVAARLRDCGAVRTYLSRISP